MTERQHDDRLGEDALELHFTTLGPLTARRAGQELRINRARDRAVLAVLLAQAGRPVTVGEIIDGVWGEEGDEAPDRAGALPGNMYRLRSALGGDGNLLRHVGKGYCLDVDPAGIDRTVFLSALADAATARLNWQPQRARELLTAALDLWQGPAALDGVPGPFAEHERRMLAGRRDEALRELDLPVRELEAGPGAGPVELRAGAARSVLRPFQLPPDPGDFTGRIAQLARISELLAVPGRTRSPLVTVAGPPGAGKSALAVRAAHLAGPDHPDGQLYADLHGADDASGYLAPFLRALGVEEQAVPASAPERRALYLRLLADRRILVVLDGAGGVEDVRPLLPAGPGCAAVVVVNGTAGEGSSSAVQVGPLAPDEALELLGRMIGRERTDREPDAARALAAACGHLPRALRDAAERLVRRPAWPISAVLPSGSSADA
ncbi:BTAD domain-containing putative transcriptional regulator [Kitasatospora sp. NPDC004615]|uniref:AfsR/SARP family transcriptional regulator n=1 Tax=Kitasatospora sp. NPDC004615 TaxID=3364017 RepID=UPI003692FB27